MNKQLLVTQISLLLDRGTAPPEMTNWFAERGHDELVERFREYLEIHRPLVGASHVEITQALNDRGTDLLLEEGDCKIGFQLKSHNDVRDDAFSANVKRQLTESHAHGLDKWYLLICSPLEYEGESYSHRIAHLMNEISTYKIRYVGAYGPRNAVLYFYDPERVSPQEFNLEVQRRTYEQTPWQAVLAAIDLSRVPDIPAAIIDDSDRYTARLPQTLENFARVVGWPELGVDLDDARATFIQVIDRLEKLPRVSRALLRVIVQRAKGDWGGMKVLASEVAMATRLNTADFRDQIAILEEHDFVSVWDSSGRGTMEVVLQDLVVGWCYDMKVYCESEGVSLERFIVDLDFSCLS